MNNDLSSNEQLCRYCHELKDVHDDWSATGEYAERVVCPTAEDEHGRVLNLCFFGPMSNLEYLEYKSKQKE
jgi:hypothetical protein